MLSNSLNFYVVFSGVDGFIVWGVKVQMFNFVVFVNLVGNGNLLYIGVMFMCDNVKNMDVFDLGFVLKVIFGKLLIGSMIILVGLILFDGYLKNFVFVYNYVSIGDDDIVFKGSVNLLLVGLGLFGVDGNCGV